MHHPFPPLCYHCTTYVWVQCYLVWLVVASADSVGDGGEPSCHAPALLLTGLMVIDATPLSLIKGGGGCSPTYACLFWGGWGCHVNQRSTLRLRSKVILHKNRLLWPSLWHLNSHCKSLLCLVQSSIFLKLCIINEGEECALMIRPLSPLISDWYRFPVVNMACHNCLDLQLLN